MACGCESRGSGEVLRDMPESFGARLRQRREQQLITLATIAEQTKIKISLLEGLERDDISHWPIGIFRRAFMRAYAQAIGLEPTTVLKEFLALHPDEIDVIPEASTNIAVDGAPPVRPPTRLGFLFQSALGSLSKGREGETSTPSIGVDEPILPARGTTAAIPFEPDFVAVAGLCTALSRLDQRSAIAPLLAEAVRIVDALGLIVWGWDPLAGELRPILAHGYSEMLLAKLPRVRRTSDNATAAAFRSGQTCVVAGGDRTSGALVVPLMTPTGCGGVLAFEVPNGREQTGSIRAVATIFAAQLARWVRAGRHTQLVDRRLA